MTYIGIYLKKRKSKVIFQKTNVWQFEENFYYVCYKEIADFSIKNHFLKTVFTLNRISIQFQFNDVNSKILTQSTLSKKLGNLGWSQSSRYTISIKFCKIFCSF